MLLDGPHAYPLPQIEFAYLFPRIGLGGWLVVDDIQIPSVYELFHFLEKESSVVLEEVAVRTAFFRRVSAAEHGPDGWVLQGMNRHTILRYSTSAIESTAPPPAKADRLSNHVGSPFNVMTPKHAFGKIDKVRRASNLPGTSSAVIGIACWFPEEMQSVGAFFQAVLNDETVIREAPRDRFEKGNRHDPAPGRAQIHHAFERAACQ